MTIIMKASNESAESAAIGMNYFLGNQFKMVRIQLEGFHKPEASWNPFPSFRLEHRLSRQSLDVFFEVGGLSSDQGL